MGVAGTGTGGGLKANDTATATGAFGVTTIALPVGSSLGASIEGDRAAGSDIESPGLSAEAADTSLGAHFQICPVILKPFGVRLVRMELDEDGTSVATDLVTEMYGAGETAEEALVDLQESLVEYADLLRVEGSARLSRRLAEHLESLARPACQDWEAVRSMTPAEPARRLYAA